MKQIRIIIAVFMATSITATAKQEATYYTPERIRTGRVNVKKYEWAQAQLQRMKTGDPIRHAVMHGYTSAESFAAQTDDFIWLLQPTTLLDRFYPNEARTRNACPVHGTKGLENSKSGPWLIDPIAHPYKIQCTAGNEWYPSNEYHKGDMTSGVFTDDGNGFVHNGKHYYPLREYALMVYGSVVIPTLRSLSQTYLLTGDEKHAHKACILLSRVASEYPNYKDRIGRTFLKGGYDSVHTWKQGGMITDLIWETFCLETTAYAYDGLYDYMDKDPKMIAFF